MRTSLPCETESSSDHPIPAFNTGRNPALRYFLAKLLFPCLNSSWLDENAVLRSVSHVISIMKAELLKLIKTYFL